MSVNWEQHEEYDEEPRELTALVLASWTFAMALGFGFWWLIFYGVGRAIDARQITP